MEEMTKKSIESRKANGDKAGKKQAVTKVMTNAFFDCPSRSTYQNKHLKQAAVDYVIEQMFGKDGEWVRDFISSQLKEAKDNPNSRAADRLAGGLFNESLWDQLDIYLNKASAEDIDYEVYKIRQTLYDRQQEVYDDNIDRRVLIINSRRSGKCWAPGTELRLFDGGLRKVEDIKVGDVLLGPDSQPRHVISLAHGFDEMYRIRSVKDEIVFECNKPHVLTLLRSHIPTKRYKVGELYDMSVEEYLNSSNRDKAAFKLIRASIEYPEQQHAIDPYLLGYWLGDGCKNAPVITVGKKESQAVDWFKRNVENLTWNECSQGRCWSIYMKGALDDFRALGFCNKDYKDNYKYIPDSYKYDSRRNRLKLLAGLIDSDGYYSRYNGSSLEYGTSDKRLCEDVLELCRSLGFHTTVTIGPSAYNGKQCKTTYNITIKGKTTEIPLVLDRKRPSTDSSQCLGYSFTVEPIGKGEYYGFTLLEPDGRCLLKDYTITHNTELLGRLIVKNLVSVPDAHVVYINRNSSAAIRQIRGPLASALEKSNLRIIKGSVDAQEVHFSNGSQLLIIGNNNASDVSKLRGERISLCLLDECGHQRNTRELVREVISPALMDYENSQLIMVGTPPRIPHTYVEECYGNSSWKKFSWTFQDNPFIPDRDKVIEEVCKETGCTPDSAFIQREYFGRMDAYDDDAKWIKKYSEVEMTQLPKVFTHAYVGVDWGYEDRAAVISVLADEVTKRAYVVDCWSEARKGIVEISNEIKRQVESLKQNFNISRPVQIICDNNEKGAVSDLVNVYKLRNVFTAYKYDKDMALDQLNDFLSGNRITFLKDKAAACVEDANNTLWKRDEETDKILHEIDDDVWHPNALMALLYVSRQFALDVCRYTDINKQARNILSGKDKNEDLEEVYNPIESEEEII